MNLKHLVIGLSIITIGALLFSGYTYREKELYKHETERLHKEEVSRLESQLKRSELERSAAVSRADSLDRLSQIIQARDSSIIDSLKRVPHKFDKLTNKQLQDKMIEEFNKAQ